jgi:hypothetical protein
MKPNLFDISTKELTQDAFLVWLLKWADKANSTEDSSLYKCGAEFAASLIRKVIPGFSEPIETVKADRQLEHIDIWAVVNEKYFIVIEDKTDSGLHGRQLASYKAWAKKNKNAYEQIFIFFKTGNESLTRIKAIEDKDEYKSYTRQDFLNILEKHSIQNDIYTDFLKHLSRIEEETNSFTNRKGLSTCLGSQGFYIYLQQHIKEWTDWTYVANASGGFMGFFYFYRTYKKDGQELSIQIENAFANGIKVAIKISGKKWERNTAILYSTLKVLNETGKQYDVSFSKPHYRVGDSSTVAIVKDPFVYDAGGNVDLDKFLELLSKLEKIITEIAK